MRFIKTLTLIAVALAATAIFAGSAEWVVKKKDAIPPAQLGISPPTIQHTVMVSQGKRLDESLVIYNYGNSPKTIKLSLFDLDTHKRPVKPNKKSLSPWVILNPREFNIPAGGQQTVRLSIRPPMSFPHKINHAMLKIEHHIQNPLSMGKDKKALILKLGASYGLPITITTK